MMNPRWLKDRTNTSSTNASKPSCTLCPLFLSLILTLVLSPETYSQPQNQYARINHQKSDPIMPMPDVIEKLRNWDIRISKPSRSASASGSSPYFLLKKFARPLQFQFQQSESAHSSQPLRLKLTDYDGLGNLQVRGVTSDSLDRNSVDLHVSDDSEQRSLSPSRQLFRDIPQITLRHTVSDNDDDQGLMASGDNVGGGYPNLHKIHKRSIGFDNGLGPIRVFKYMSEDTVLQTLSQDSSTTNGTGKVDANDDSKVVKHKPRRKLKSNRTSTLNSKTKSKLEYLPDLKPSTVPDRSLIRNSFFGSEPQDQRHNQTKNEQAKSVTQATSHRNTTVFSNKSTTTNATSPINTRGNKEGSRSRNPSTKPSVQGRKNGTGRNDSKRKGVPNAEFLLYNASLSERPRRSPFRSLQQPPFIFQNQQRQNMQQSFQKQNMHQPFQQQQNMQQQFQQQQRFTQNQQPNNRAAMFMRNGGINPPQNIPQQPPGFQRFPTGQNVPNLQPPYPNLQLTVPPPPKAPNNDILPSASTGFFNYRQSPQAMPYSSMEPASIPESTWNHPLYRQYSKAARRVQNEVTRVVGGKGSQSRRNFNSAIPLPRPKPSNQKSRRIRTRHRGNSNNNPNHHNSNGGNLRYSYPKSAQNIQDILNHFQQNNNDILDSVPKSSKNRHSGGGRPGNGGPGNDGPGNRGPESGGPGPGNQGFSIASDLSSELDNVKFSLLRDIREFSKRPSHNVMTSEDDQRHHHDDSNRYRDAPSQKRAPFYSDDHKKNSYRASETKRYHHNHNDDDDSPAHSASYQNDDGYDEITNPKPKPVRDMVKKSSKFRDHHSERDRDTSSSREKESQHSKKRDRLPHYSDRDDDNRDHKNYDSEDGHTSSYGKHSTKAAFDDDSTERYPVREDRHKNDRPIRHHHHSSERDRSRPHTSKEDRSRDRDHSYSKERSKRPGGKFSHRDSDDFNSFEVRNSKPSSTYYRPTEREPEPGTINRELMEYPKSIRDKIREVSGEFDRKLNREPSSHYRATNKPIVIKRPYEPYRIPPTILTPNFEIPTKPSEQEFWNHFGSATETSLYGINPRPGPGRSPPLVISSPSGGYTPRYGVSPTMYNPRPTPSLIPEDEDILEIHTGLPQPTRHDVEQDKEKSLQKAYMELLQHKMQAESALLNNPLVMSSSHPQSHPQQRHKKTPMRMKIHIYPNNEAGGSGTELNNQNSPHQFGQSQILYGGSGYSESHPSSILSIAPQRDSQKIGGSLRSSHMNMNQRHHQGHSGPGPAPPTQIGYGSGGINPNPKPSLSSTDKNKNLVLHLHVHRRNDGGGVELDTEASEIHTSTAKPLTYNRDIFEGHNQQEDQQPSGGDVEPNKSVSMEVPIHDDKIEDVLHTLLQFRDRGGDKRKKRNHGPDEVT